MCLSSSPQPAWPSFPQPSHTSVGSVSQSMPPPRPSTAAERPASPMGLFICLLGESILHGSMQTPELYTHMSKTAVRPCSHRRLPAAATSTDLPSPHIQFHRHHSDVIHNASLLDQPLAPGSLDQLQSTRAVQHSTRMSVCARTYCQTVLASEQANRQTCGGFAAPRTAGNAQAAAGQQIAGREVMGTSCAM